jgi:hypothetical protein
MYKKMSAIMALAIATILTTYVSALTMSNQAFAQHNSWYNDISSPHGQPGTSTTPHNLGMAFDPCTGSKQLILFSALGHPASNSGHVGSPTAQASFDPCSGQILFSALGHPASNSGHGGHPGLLGQIQTHPNIASVIRAQGHTITPYIRNLFIPAGMQHGYFVGSGALLGQPASISGHVVQPGLPGR